jgi:hypothetical protein
MQAKARPLYEPGFSNAAFRATAETHTTADDRPGGQTELPQKPPRTGQDILALQTREPVQFSNLVVWASFDQLPED